MQDFWWVTSLFLPVSWIFRGNRGTFGGYKLFVTLNIPSELSLEVMHPFGVSEIFKSESKTIQGLGNHIFHIFTFPLLWVIKWEQRLCKMSKDYSTASLTLKVSGKFLMLAVYFIFASWIWIDRYSPSDSGIDVTSWLRTVRVDYRLFDSRI